MAATEQKTITPEITTNRPVAQPTSSDLPNQSTAANLTSWLVVLSAFFRTYAPLLPGHSLGRTQTVICHKIRPKTSIKRTRTSCQRTNRFRFIINQRKTSLERTRNPLERTKLYIYNNAKRSLQLCILTFKKRRSGCVHTYDVSK